MICKHCGNTLSENSKFCNMCGNTVPPLVEEQISIPANTGRTTNHLVIILLSVVIVLFLALVILGAKLFMQKPAPQTDTPSAQIQEEIPLPEELPETTSVTFPRHTTYSPYYTYKNMPDIHNSVPAEDEECFELEEFINTYNVNWLSFVNYGDTSIYAYLRPNTQAYKYTNNYKNKNIYEEFELTDVKDVRKFGSCYYVWVHELITEFSENNTRNLEYYWVYKIGKDASGYYVEDYTQDPFYK